MDPPPGSGSTENWVGVGKPVLALPLLLRISPQDEATSITTVVRPELRPFEEVDDKEYVGKLLISDCYRLEERFLGKIVKNLNVPGYTFNYRFRYQLQLIYPLIDKPAEKGGLDIRANDEIFLNFGSYIVKNTFDQNRAFIGFVYGISKSSQFEAGYMNWFQERSDGTNYRNRNILRLTFYHTFQVGKVKT